jgi:NTE family protein
VIVDAQVNPQKRFDLTPSSPGLRELVGLITGSQLNHFSFETIELARSSLEGWAEQLTRSHKGPSVKTHLIEVSFAMSENPEERAFLNGLPTSFDLDDEDVDRLIEFGRRTFRASPDAKRLLERLRR